MNSIIDELNAVEREIEERRRRVVRRSVIAAALPLSIAIALFLGGGIGTAHYHDAAVRYHDEVVRLQAVNRERRRVFDSGDLRGPELPITMDAAEHLRTIDSLRSIVDSLRNVAVSAPAHDTPSLSASIGEDLLRADALIGDDLKRANSLIDQIMNQPKGPEPLQYSPKDLIAQLSRYQGVAEKMNDKEQLRTLTSTIAVLKWAGSAQQTDEGLDARLKQSRAAVREAEANNERLRGLIVKYTSQ